MKISIITPCFNAVSTIERAIKSVLSQNYNDCEHIVIDGGSTDGTVELLKQYDHLIWLSEKDRGQSHAMNKGVTMASGDIVGILNADDEYDKGVFAIVNEEMLKGNFNIVFGKLRIKYDIGRTRIQKPNLDYKKMLRFWEKDAFPLNPVQYFCKKIVHDTFPFNEDNYYAMDHEFLLNAVRKFSHSYVNKIFGTFFLLGDTKTMELLNMPLKYWRIENFLHVDRFLNVLDRDELIDFKNDQLKLFTEKVRQAGCSNDHQKILVNVNRLVNARNPFVKLRGIMEIWRLYKNI